MQRLRLTVAYVGTSYSGFQLQGVLEDAIGRVLKLSSASRVVVVGSSRTDAGVHARGQCCHVDLPKGVHVTNTQALMHRLNRALPPDVSVCELRIAEPGFHAQYSVVGKCYHYRICCADWQDPTQRVTQWWVAGRWNVANRGLPDKAGAYDLNVDLMNLASGMLVGTHDFSAFKDKHTAAQQAKNPIRTLTTVSVEREQHAGHLVVVVAGRGFLFRMVRVIVAALVEVGAGRLAVSTIGEALSTGNRALLPGAAPPEGLSLVHIAFK